MNEPHVNALYYKLIVEKDIDFNRASPIQEETDDFIFSLSHKEAIFIMKAHFAKENDAKKITDGFLNSYLVLWGIEHPSDDIKFLFKSSEIVDKKPSNDHTLSICVNDTINLECSVDVHVSRLKFPQPPKDFTVSPDVETIFSRFKSAMQKKEPLLSMAYMCFTVIEASAGSRRAAAKKYNIDMKVLNKWGELVSTKGSKSEARKTPKKGSFVPLQPEERKWIIELIKKVILRLGSYAYDPKQSFTKINLSDLPQLNP